MAHVNVTEEYRPVLEAAVERGWKPVAQRGGLGSSPLSALSSPRTYTQRAGLSPAGRRLS